MTQPEQLEPQTAMGKSDPFRRPVVLLMTLSHLLNDLYANSLTPILPIVIQDLGLSMTLAGLLTTLRMISGQMAQPVYGFLGDKLGRRLLMGLGPLLTVSIMGLAGWAPNYTVLALFVILAGVGSASFHPQAAAVAGEASGGRRHGLGVAVFLSGGVLGVALAPWLVVPIVSRLGLRGTLVAALPGLAVGAFLWRAEGRLGLGKAADRPSWKLDFGGHGRTLAILLAIAICRTVMESSMVTFLPVLMQEQGFSLMGAGAVYSVFLLCIAVGSMLGGYLGDLLDPRWIIGITMLLGIPLVQAALRVEGATSVALWILGGMLLMSSGSLNIALAQRFAPANAGTASSVMMGLGLGLGGIGATLVGRLADAIGLVPAFQWLMWLPILPAALTLLLPRLPAPLPKPLPEET